MSRGSDFFHRSWGALPSATGQEYLSRCDPRAAGPHATLFSADRCGGPECGPVGRLPCRLRRRQEQPRVRPGPTDALPDQATRSQRVLLSSDRRPPGPRSPFAARAVCPNGPSPSHIRETAREVLLSSQQKRPSAAGAGLREGRYGLRVRTGWSDRGAGPQRQATLRPRVTKTFASPAVVATASESDGSGRRRNLLNPGATPTSHPRRRMPPSHTTATTVRPGRRDATDIRCAPTESASHLPGRLPLLCPEPRPIPPSAVPTSPALPPPAIVCVLRRRAAGTPPVPMCELSTLLRSLKIDGRPLAFVHAVLISECAPEAPRDWALDILGVHAEDVDRLKSPPPQSVRRPRGGLQRHGAWSAGGGTWPRAPAGERAAAQLREVGKPRRPHGGSGARLLVPRPAHRYQRAAAGLGDNELESCASLRSAFRASS